MLKSVKIKKLFGRFNYSIELKQEGVTIITGPNGYGKTTILKILNDFSNKSFKDFFNYTFATITFDFGEENLIIKKLTHSFKVNDIEFPYPQETKPIRRRYELPPFIRRVGPNEFIDIRTNEVVYIDDARVFMDEEDLPTKDRFFDLVWNTILWDKPKEPKIKHKELISAIEAINNAKQLIGNIRFIQEQRLIEEREIPEDRRSYSGPKTELIHVLSDNAKKLKQQIEKTMSLHSSVSNDLDGTYIKRLFDLKVSNREIDYQEALKELQAKQAKLTHYGLAEISNADYLLNSDSSEFNRFAIELAIYFEDANKKFAVFEPLISKLDLYEKIVNDKLAFKTMKITRNEGISVITDEGKVLDLNKLSSGEQEILVLFYKLIFESDVNLLLVDEPEISLHIAWQKELLNDFKEIVALNKNMNVIIATHSPQIISNNWDLQIDLGGQYNG